MSSSSALAVLGGKARNRRPKPAQQPALPAFDQNDPDGQGDVATSPPPGWNPTEANVSGDFAGLTLPGDFDPPWAYGDPPPVDAAGVTMTSGPYKGLHIPWRLGANSTPTPMLFSGMLPMYPKDVQDAYLTEYALRGYRDLMIAPDGWNYDANGFQMTPDVLLAWASYARNVWGNRIVLWRGAIQPNGDPYLVALYKAGLIGGEAGGLYVMGKEIDGQMNAPDLPPMINRHIADTDRQVRLGVHFSANDLVNGDPLSKGGGYPLLFPKDTFLAGGATGSWADYDGILDLCHQAQQDNSAGRQPALLYYSRQRVQLGGVGGDGRPAPNCRIIIYEQQATNELYGRPALWRPGQFTDELYGKLRTLQMLWAGTGGLSGLSVLTDFMNGASLPNGWPVWMVNQQAA